METNVAAAEAAAYSFDATATAAKDSIDDAPRTALVAVHDDIALLAQKLRASRWNSAIGVRDPSHTFFAQSTSMDVSSSEPWSALALSLVSITGGAESAADAAILKMSTLGDVTSCACSGGGGAANDEVNGGGGGGSNLASGDGNSGGAANDAFMNAPAIAVEALAEPVAPEGTQAGTASSAGLKLMDADGTAVDFVLDENTVVIGAATWCGYCAQLKAQLNAPEAQTALEGLRVVFAFGNEGGSGPGGVLYSEFLADLPGELAFLAADSVQPEGFPSAFDAATGQFDLDPMSAIQSWWLTKNGIDASAATTAASGIALMDATGAPLDITPDANTLIIGSATWCGATAKFKEALSRPEVAEQLTGLRIVFAFDNEGGVGPGGVQNAEFLADMPGEVAFLASGSVRPARLPMAYNAASGQFDLTAVDALNAWASGTLVSGGTCGNKNAVATVAGDSTAPGFNPRLGETRPHVGESLRDSLGGAGGSVLVGDFNGDNAVDAADYVVYRKTFGQTGAGLAADGSGNEIVDEADYDLWG